MESTFKDQQNSVKIYEDRKISFGYKGQATTQKKSTKYSKKLQEKESSTPFNQYFTKKTNARHSKTNTLDLVNQESPHHHTPQSPPTNLESQHSQEIIGHTLNQFKFSNIDIKQLNLTKKGQHSRHKTIGFPGFTPLTAETPDFSPNKELPTLLAKGLTEYADGHFKIKEELDSESEFEIYRPRGASKQTVIINKELGVEDLMQHGEIKDEIESRKKELDRIYTELQMLESSLDKKEWEKAKEKLNLQKGGDDSDTKRYFR